MAATALRIDAIERWWPLTQSLDLVEATLAITAEAVRTEVTRFLEGETLAVRWAEFPAVDAALGAAPGFANVPTFYLVLPSRSRWTVLWNNCFLADGYALPGRCFVLERTSVPPSVLLRTREEVLGRANRPRKAMER